MLHKFSNLIKHSTHITTIIFIGGFIFDMIMLPDINHPLTRYIGLAHLCVVAFLILFREWIVSRNTASLIEQKIYSISTFGISFSSGAALSFLSVYSIRSAEFSVSWPLFIFLFLCIVANEIVSTHSFRFTLDVGVLLVASLFYLIFNIPVFLKVQNDVTFSISVGVSIVISFLYLYFLQFTSESARYEAPRSYALAIGIPMFVFMLYFLNVIPAVPLSLKDSGIYHSVVHTSTGEFIAQKENDNRNFLYFRTPIYHYSPPDTGVYFFSAVSAPGELSAPLSHVWEKYNEKTKQWEGGETIPISLIGGREGGYRAYSKKENISPGLWRVTVKVDSMRVVGRLKFWVENGSLNDLQEIKL